MLVPVKVAKHNSKGQEIRIIMKTWRYQLRGQVGSLRKIVMQKPYPIQNIMHKIDTEFIKKNGDISDRNKNWAVFPHAEPKPRIVEKLIGSQLNFDGITKNWISSWAQPFRDYDVTINEKLTAARDNGGDSRNREIRFYEDLQKMNLFDIALKTGIETEATCEILHDEVANFSRGFSIWC